MPTKYEQAQELAEKAEQARQNFNDKRAAYLAALRNGNAGPWSDTAQGEMEAAKAAMEQAERAHEDFVKVP